MNSVGPILAQVGPRTGEDARLPALMDLRQGP
jgi:hypothetical protein